VFFFAARPKFALNVRLSLAKFLAKFLPNFCQILPNSAHFQVPSCKPNMSPKYYLAHSAASLKWRPSGAIVWLALRNLATFLSLSLCAPDANLSVGPEVRPKVRQKWTSVCV